MSGLDTSHKKSKPKDNLPYQKTCILSMHNHKTTINNGLSILEDEGLEDVNESEVTLIDIINRWSKSWMPGRHPCPNLP